MEGAADRDRRQLNAELFGAWHTARFVLNGYADKGKMAGGKSLADILLKGDDEVERPPDYAQAIHFFHSLKARGFPVEITRH